MVEMVEYNVTLKEPNHYGSDLIVVIRREGNRGTMTHREEHTLIIPRKTMEDTTVSGLLMILRAMMGDDSLPTKS